MHGAVFVAVSVRGSRGYVVRQQRATTIAAQIYREGAIEKRLLCCILDYK